MPETDQDQQQQPTKSKVNLPLQQAIEALLTDQPVSYHPLLARLVKSATAGLLLSQFLYWMPRTRDPEGWFYKSQAEIYQETGLTRWEQETARRDLRQLKVLEEKLRGMPSRLYFRINMTALTKLLTEGLRQAAMAQDAENPHPRMRKNRNQGSGKPTNKDAENPPANTETTAETTQRPQQHSAHVPARPEADTEPRGSDVVVPSRIGKKGSQTRAEVDPPDGNGELQQELIRRGVAESSAAVLVRKKDPELIREKLALFDWAKQHRPGMISKSDGGWLRQAITSNYPLPTDYLQHQRQAEQRRRQAEEGSSPPVEGVELVEERSAEVDVLARLREEFGTSEQEAALWQQVLEAVKRRPDISTTEFRSWIAPNQLLAIRDGVAFIGSPSQFQAQKLRGRGHEHVILETMQALGQPVEEARAVWPTKAAETGSADLAHTAVSVPQNGAETDQWSSVGTVVSERTAGLLLPPAADQGRSDSPIASSVTPTPDTDAVRVPKVFSKAE